jgi:hypothetical protein
MNALFSPKAQLILGWGLLIGSLIGWPVTAMTIFSSEPQGILGLSWGAIVLNAWGIIVACQINKDVVDVQAGKANVEAENVTVNEREGAAPSASEDG